MTFEVRPDWCGGSDRRCLTTNSTEPHKLKNFLTLPGLEISASRIRFEAHLRFSATSVTLHAESEVKNRHAKNRAAWHYPDDVGRRGKRSNSYQRERLLRILLLQHRYLFHRSRQYQRVGGIGGRQA